MIRWLDWPAEKGTRRPWDGRLRQKVPKRMKVSCLMLSCSGHVGVEKTDGKKEGDAIVRLYLTGCEEQGTLKNVG